MPPAELVAVASSHPNVLAHVALAGTRLPASLFDQRQRVASAALPRRAIVLEVVRSPTSDRSPRPRRRQVPICQSLPRRLEPCARNVVAGGSVDMRYPQGSVQISAVRSAPAPLACRAAAGPLVVRFRYRPAEPESEGAGRQRRGSRIATWLVLSCGSWVEEGLH